RGNIFIPREVLRLRSRSRTNRGKGKSSRDFAQDDGDGRTGISFCRKGILAAAQSTMLSPERPKSAALAWLGSMVRLKGMPSVWTTCVAAPGCASQYEKPAALMNRRIARLSALVRSHSARV